MTSLARRVKFLREGKYFAEVTVDIIQDELGWTSGLTPGWG